MFDQAKVTHPIQNKEMDLEIVAQVPKQDVVQEKPPQMVPEKHV